ncbi:MAG: hypothetical protein H6Q15_2455 [Bacteroidetes bacterium]|nr:hypothetical protein [Bacteroidota bacterium]
MYFQVLIYIFAQDQNIYKMGLYFSSTELLDRMTININFYSIHSVSKVMNISSSDVLIILKNAGFTLDEGYHTLLNQKHLDVLSKKYIEYLQRYFSNSLKNIHNLSFSEIIDFDDFCNRFRKQNNPIKGVIQWSHINTELLKDFFFEQVKEENNKINSFFSLFENVFTYESILQAKFSYYIKENNLMKKIVSNRFYRIKIKIKKIFCFFIQVIKLIIRSYRYHIFVTEDSHNSKVQALCIASLE